MPTEIFQNKLDFDIRKVFFQKSNRITKILISKPTDRQLCNTKFFVQSQKDNFVASVVGMPNVIVEANTEEEAISKVKSALQAQLATGKFVTIEVNPKEIHHQETTQMKYAGIFANDPTFDDFMEKLAAIRFSCNCTMNSNC